MSKVSYGNEQETFTVSLEQDVRAVSSYVGFIRFWWLWLKYCFMFEFQMKMKWTKHDKDLKLSLTIIGPAERINPICEQTLVWAKQQPGAKIIDKE